MKRLEIIGIYKITNTVNNKIYIGSSKNIDSRFRNHNLLLKTNRHKNNYLQSSYLKYGSNNFTFEIIEICNIENLLEREQFYIDTLNPDYNLSKIASQVGGGNKSNNKRIHSEKTIEKMKSNYIDRRDNHPLHKMKIDDVIELINLFNNGSPILKLAVMFDIGEKTVLGILAGRSWKDVYHLVDQDKYFEITSKRRGFNKIYNKNKLCSA